MGVKIYYKNGIPGTFTDESIRLSNPEKKGWKPLETTSEAIPPAVVDFLNQPLKKKGGRPKKTS